MGFDNSFYEKRTFYNPHMDQTTEEKTNKRILELQKVIEKEIEEKKNILNDLVLQNEEMDREKEMLEEWYAKY